MKSTSNAGRWTLYVIASLNGGYGPQRQEQLGRFRSKSRARKAARRFRKALEGDYKHSDREPPVVRFALQKNRPGRLSARGLALLRAHYAPGVV